MLSYLFTHLHLDTANVATAAVPNRPPQASTGTHGPPPFHNCLSAFLKNARRGPRIGHGPWKLLLYYDNTIYVIKQKDKINYDYLWNSSEPFCTLLKRNFSSRNLQFGLLKQPMRRLAATYKYPASAIVASRLVKDGFFLYVVFYYVVN